MLENDENENGDSGLQGENLPPQEGINTPGLDVFGPPSYAESENTDSGVQGMQGEPLPPQEGIDTLGLDVFGPPCYAENEDSGEQENQNLLDTLGHKEFFPPNYAEQLDCVEEDRLLESKGAIIIEGIESDEVGKLQFLNS